jgi:hypothetical protein
MSEIIIKERPMAPEGRRILGQFCIAAKVNGQPRYIIPFDVRLERSSILGN